MFDHTTPVSVALVNVVAPKSAPVRFAPVRFASLKLASVMEASVKSAFCRFVPARLTRSRVQLSAHTPDPVSGLVVHPVTF